MKAICKLKDLYKVLHDFEASFLSSYGITLNEGIIMCMLSEGPRNAGEICTDCTLSTSRLSKVLNALEEKGYIQRSIAPKDRRQVKVELTSKGCEKVGIMQQEDILIPEALSCFITQE